MINVPVVTPWNVRTPQVYRYLDQRYVDAFFETGSIRLSSFAQFATYPDEEKGDTKEGDHVFYAKDTPHSAMVRASFGKDAIFSLSRPSEPGVDEQV